MDYESILEDVLKRVKPSKEEEESIRVKADELISLLRTKFKDVKLLGSVAKGTFLKGSSDLDVFVFFPKSMSKEEMEERFIDACKDLLKHVELRYAEHPYVRVNYKGINADIVPAYKVSEGEVLSAVDRSPFHTQFILNNLSHEQKDEVRLLKAFTKGIGIYGAEIKIKGFSGYLLELLIVKYGSFLNTLKKVSKWRKPVRIFIKEEHKKYLPQFTDLFVVIDPTDPRRNVASPVSLERLARFIMGSRSFLKNPSLEFFFPSKKIESKLYLVGLKLKNVSVVDDVKYGQVLRIERALKNFLKTNSFDIGNSFICETKDNIYIVFLLTNQRLSEFAIRRGPPIYKEKNVAKFLSKGIHYFFEEDSILKVVRRQGDILDYIKKFISTYQFPSHFKDTNKDIVSSFPREIIDCISKQIYIDYLTIGVVDEGKVH